MPIYNIVYDINVSKRKIVHLKKHLGEQKWNWNNVVIRKSLLAVVHDAINIKVHNIKLTLFLQAGFSKY